MRIYLAFSWVNIRKFYSIKIIALVLLVGCTQLKDIGEIDNSCESRFADSGTSNISLFLNIKHQGPTTNLNLKINSIELLLDDVWVPFPSDVIQIQTFDDKSIQKFLGREWLTGKLCKGIRVKTEIFKTSGNKPDNISKSGDGKLSEILLQNPFELEPNSRKVLFLEWNSSKSFSNPQIPGDLFGSYLGSATRVTANLVYIACPDIDTVYVVKADKFQVVDAFSVKGRPSYLAVNSDNKRIYVLSELQNKIVPYDLSSHYPDSELVVSLAISPNFMVLNNNSQVAYVLDERGVLTSIDLLNGNLLNRNRIGNRPDYVYYIADFNKLAVSSNFDQTVYIVNPDTLAIEDSIILGAVPHGLIVWKNYLYIAEGNTNSVSIYDLTARKIFKNIRVGIEPFRFASTNNSVYVSNYGDGTLSIMQGEQFSVIKELRVGKNIREMAVAEKQSLLLVGQGDCNDGSLVVVDATANQVIGRVELGTKPMGIAVVE